jgi:hypothetical protein
MSIRTWVVIGWLAWGTAAFGILNLDLIPGDYGDWLCGPWG